MGEDYYCGTQQVLEGWGVVLFPKYKKIFLGGGLSLKEDYKQLKSDGANIL